MTQMSLFKKEIAFEGITARKMLAIVPFEKFDWKPHPRSMTIRQLATHIAELPGWISMVLHSDELDFSKMDYKPAELKSTPDLVALLDKNLAEAEQVLSLDDDSTMQEPWTLRNGDKIYSTEPKADVIRMSISQVIHHRAQLGVFLRLLDIPIPGSYGPSADEPGLF